MVKKDGAEVAQCSEVKGSACMQSMPARVMVSKHEAEVVQCSAVQCSAVQCLHVVYASQGNGEEA